MSSSKLAARFPQLDRLAEALYRVLAQQHPEAEAIRIDVGQGPEDMLQVFLVDERGVNLLRVRVFGAGVAGITAFRVEPGLVDGLRYVEPFKKAMVEAWKQLAPARADGC